MILSLTGVSDCILALGFEKMQRGSLSGKVKLNIIYTYQFKILILTFKSIYGLALSYIYLGDFIKVKQKSSDLTLHSDNSLQYC